MAKKTFQGRPVLSGKLKGKALVSKQAFNLTGSFLKNMFAGETKTCLLYTSPSPLDRQKARMPSCA